MTAVEVPITSAPQRSEQSIEMDHAKPKWEHGADPNAFSPSPELAEGGGRTGPARKGGRIDQVHAKSISGNMAGLAVNDSDSSLGTSIRKQMELEAGNDIQYRTCSWEKV